VFGDESIELGLANQVAKPIREFGKGHRETRMESAEAEGALVGAARQMLAECRAFHFHDTSSVSRMRQAVYIHDNKHLRHDGGNLAAFLYKLQKRHTPAYQRIVQTVRQIAPWFGEFVLEPLELNENNLLLRWREQDSRAVFGPHQASDGTLRGMALVALLLQPEEDLPGLIVIDEPELGLHPYALVVVAALLKQAAHRSQVVVATQSVALLDQFSVEDVIVVDRAGSRSVFQRLSQERMVEWLEDYSLGELWQKNVLGGVPA
jgi:predicted ATPase